MTVSYSKEAATATFYNFARLLFKWKGSVWKFILVEAIVWSLLYFALQLVYFFVLRHTYYNQYFESLHRLFKGAETDNGLNTLLSIILGFFTSITIARWWAIYELLEWPDGLASVVATHLNRIDSIKPLEMRRIRRTCARYIMLSYIFLLRDISEPVKRRFPEFDSVGVMITSEELAAIKDMTEKGHTTCKYAIPLHWMTWMLKKLYYEHDPSKHPHGKRRRKQPAINKYQYVQLMTEIFKFRSSLGDVSAYDFVPNPILAYTQVCILAVYGYLAQQIISRQVLVDDGHGWNVAITFLIALAENICYLGWFKASLMMINPFGFNDDDFELLWLIDRHWGVVKKVLEDPWATQDLPDDVRREGAVNVTRAEDLPLPHTLRSAAALLNRNRLPTIQGSMVNLHVSDEEVIYTENEP